MKRSVLILSTIVLLGICSAICFAQSSSPREILEKNKVSIPKEAGSGWLSAVQADISEMEYAVTMHEQGRGVSYQAPNRANGFRSVFEDKGVRLEPRQTGENDWSLSFGLKRKMGEAPATLVKRTAWSTSTDGLTSGI